MNNKEKEIKWYESSNIITTLMIGIILLIIVCSQSFAVRGEYSLALFGSVINHNSVYLLVIIYFILLKTRFGKKYFNYLNLTLIFIYGLTMITSLLTVVQAFSLNTVLAFFTNLVMFIYLSHTMFRDTRIWKEFRLYNSPFNELTNDWYFYTILILSLILLTVNLVSTVVIGGVIISILDTIYVVLFSRYVYLYRSYLDLKNKESKNNGNFSEIRENIKDVYEDISNKIDDFMENSGIDEKISEVRNVVEKGTDELKEKVEDFTSKAKARDKVEDFSKENKSDNKKSTKKNQSKKGDVK